MRAVALTLVLANMAFGVVPPPAYVGSWRRDGAGKPMPCDNYTVLRDFQTGWPGKCLSLTQTNHTANKTCAETCLADPECTVWQINDATGCWVGGAGIGKGAVAEKCYGREGDLGFVLKGAQRFQHGQVMVVLDMNATWVDGLYTLGIGDYPNGTEGVARCKAACYSDIHCNFWQFGGTAGCQVETSTYKAANPPVMHNGTAEAKALVAGQIIEHYCESHHAVKESKLWLILGISWEAFSGFASSWASSRPCSAGARRPSPRGPAPSSSRSRNRRRRSHS